MSYNDTPHDEAESCSKNLLDELLAARVLAFYLAETQQFIKTNDTRANESIPQTNTKGRTKARPEFLQSLTNGQSCSVGTHLFCPYYPFKSPSGCFGNAIIFLLQLCRRGIKLWTRRIKLRTTRIKSWTE